MATIDTISLYATKLLEADTENFIERTAIIFVYSIVAWILHFVVIRVLRAAARKTRIPFDDFLLQFIQTPLALTLFLFGCMHAVLTDPAPKAPYDFMLPAVIRSAMLLVWVIAILRSMNRLNEISAGILLRREEFDRDLFYMFKNISRIVIVFTAILWVLTIWDIAITPIFASAGIAGIAIALAAKDTLANFFGGISIYMDRSYKVSEYIILDSGERGEVVELGIRSTKIKTRDDVLITIPNSIMASSKIINQSAPKPSFRIRVDVGVAYGSDLDQVENVLMEIAQKHPGVAKAPAPRVRARRFGDSSIDFQLLCWVNDPRVRGRMTHDLIKEIYKTFNEQAIQIPFPQRDVHLVSAKTEE